MILPFEQNAAGLYVERIDVEHIRCDSREPDLLDRLAPEANGDLALRLDPHTLASGAGASDGFGVFEMDLGVATHGLEEFVGIGDDRELADDEGIGAEVGYFLLPVLVETFEH